METRVVDLYGASGLPRPERAVGRLEGWYYETPAQLGVNRQRPAVLLLPGGAYRWTSDRESEPVALRFAARGYIPFVLRYTCAAPTFPTALQEAALAMRYIREHAEEYDVAPDRVAALGYSAGGHLCGLLGTLYDSPEVTAVCPAALARPEAMALCYPVAVSWGNTHEESFENLTGGDRALRERLSLEKLVRPDMPPVFLWHTRDDPAVPVRNSLVLAQALDEAGVDFALQVYRHGQHGLSTADEQVYPAYALPQVSAGLPRWPEDVMAFFAGSGLTIRDQEGGSG